MTAIFVGKMSTGSPQSFARKDQTRNIGYLFS